MGKMAKVQLSGPTGVKYATERIRQVLQDDKPQFLIRADIRSFYRSIPHFKLVEDIKKYYDDPKLLAMLENIITNPIETPRGYKNPGTGIALRGPLSQFFSGLYLKRLDDAFDKMDVSYFRFQDDLLILCKSKRQLLRCRRVMMAVLHERRLTLSRKKSRMGSIKDSFHFLGIQYSQTQTGNNTEVTHANDVQYVAGMGGEATSGHQGHAALQMTPHPRTLRKARMQVQQMVAIGISAKRIRSYLHHFLLWWVNTTKIWNYEELIQWFCDACFDITPAAYAAGLRLCIRKSHSPLAYDLKGIGAAVDALAA